MNKYDIVVADPPWPQKKGGLRKVRPNQSRNLDYPTMSLEWIKKVLNFFNGKILFLWTIDKFLVESEIICRELGYKLHARFIWNKENGVAPAFTVRYSHEYLLWFYKKPMLKINKTTRGKYTTVFTVKATKHSEKPEFPYKMIEDFYPNYSKIELFARKPRSGWDVWGNEVNGINVEIPF